MGTLKFRDLTAEEIECRVGHITASGLSILLYKNARVDCAILDETVGQLNWQNAYSRDNQNCTVSIWDKKKSQWISKENTGTESNTEKEKGLASDSFKRACFNWGIGRELYTAPFIWIKKDLCNIASEAGRYTCHDKFKVEKILIEDKKIIAISIINQSTGKRVYIWQAERAKR